MTTTFGTLATEPGFPASVNVIRRTVTSSKIQGFVQRRQTQSSVSRNTNRREVRRWQLSFNILNSAEFAEVSAAFNDAAGSGLPIAFAPPDEGAEIPIRFLSNTLRFGVRDNHFFARTQVEEVI